MYKLANRDPNVRVNDFMRTAWMDANVKAHRVEEALEIYDSIIDSYSNVENVDKIVSSASPSIVTFGSALFGCLTMSVERENVDVRRIRRIKFSRIWQNSTSFLTIGVVISLSKSFLEPGVLEDTLSNLNP